MTVATGVALHTQADYLRLLLQLLPSGPAWPKETTSVLSQVLSPYMLTVSRMDQRASDVVAEAFPTTTSEMLTDWETSLGLPDPCAGIAPTVATRRAQVVARFCATGGSSVADIEQFASLLGYTVDIEQCAPFWPGVTAVDGVSVLAPDDWTFHLIVTVNNGDATSAVLNCELLRIIPAHADCEIRFGTSVLDEFVLDRNILG